MVKEITKSYYLLLLLPTTLSVVAFMSTAKEALIPVLFAILMVGLAIYTNDEPRIDIALSLSRKRVFVGDEVEMIINVRVKRGLGVIAINVPPASYAASRHRESFDIVSGRASHVIFKGFRDGEWAFRVRIKALRRGRFEFGLINYAYHHVFGMRVIEDRIKVSEELLVVPRYRIIRRSLGRIKPSTLTPRTTPTRVGPPSSDFLEVRNYLPGDPFKFINWKASARSPQGNLFINEYEREGLRAGIFLLDVGEWMRLGLPHENPLEYSVSLILSLSKMMLRYGYNVGLWTVPDTGIRVMPSSGQTQFQRIMNALLLVEAGRGGAMIDPAMIRVIMETRPILIMTSNLAAPGAINSIRSICSDRKCISRTILIDINHSSIALRERLRNYGDVSCIPRINEKRDLLPRGALVTTWDPACEGVGTVVVRLMPMIRWLS